MEDAYSDGAFYTLSTADVWRLMNAAWSAFFSGRLSDSQVRYESFEAVSLPTTASVQSTAVLLLARRTLTVFNLSLGKYLADIIEIFTT